MEIQVENFVALTRTWAIVEVMGHASYGGAVREVERLGAKFLEVTVMASPRNREFTVLLSAPSIFRMRETTEAAARANWSSIPDEHRIEAPQPGRLVYDDPDDRPPAADAATSIESHFDSELDDEFDDEDDDEEKRERWGAEG